MTFTRQFRIASDPGTGKEALFPSRAASRSLAWRNLGFAALNSGFATTLGVICAIFAWLIDTNARITGTTLPAALNSAPTFSEALWAYVQLVFVSPWPPMLAALTVGGYIYFADFKGSWRVLAGSVHALAQMGLVVLATLLLAWYAPGAQRSALLVPYVGVVGGLLVATTMGAYLLICLNVFGKHWNEAFSSLRIEDFKCFLRVRIGKDGNLTLFPIGLPHLKAGGNGVMRSFLARPQTIESPIVAA